VLPLVRGDRYVLCSDGLVDEVEDNQISAILATNAHPQAAADALVEAANQNGGRDNTTVIVVDVLEGADPLADTADLELDPTWAEEQPDRLIDADPHVDDTMMLALPSPTTVAYPDGDVPRNRRRLGALLFVLALVAIAVLTITLVLVVRHNSSNTPATTTVPATTTPPSSSTSTTTSTSTPTTSTAASTSSSAGP
jgi:hypothetical protein